VSTCNDESIFTEVDIEAKLSYQVVWVPDVFKCHGQLWADADQTRVQLETISHLTSQLSAGLYTYVTLFHQHITQLDCEKNDPEFVSVTKAPPKVNQFFHW